MKKLKGSGHEPPVFDLNAFGKKASHAEFYIQTLQEHSREHKFISKPHKHDFYLILFVTQGGGIHSIDFESYQIKRNSVFLMTPGQVHSWELSPDTDGYIVFFTKAFYQLQATEANLFSFPFYHSLSATPLILIEPDVAVDFVFKQMLQEFRFSAERSNRLLRTYLDVLLLKFSNYFPDRDEVKPGTTTYRLRKLEQLIDRKFRTMRQASDYADLMNLSTAYLNSICKDNLGKTLTDIIQERVILEAKRLFAYSEMNVNEVAGKLNFTDVSYFIRFFRKQVGQTPEQFRQSL